MALSGISGEKLGKKICDAMGLDPSKIMRIIVDCKAGDGALEVYVVYAGEEKLLDVDWPEALKGIIVNGAEDTVGTFGSSP